MMRLSQTLAILADENATLNHLIQAVYRFKTILLDNGVDLIRINLRDFS